MAVLSSSEARRERARRGQRNAQRNRPTCRGCGKKNMSAAVTDPLGTVRICRSCGHEQGIIDGKAFGYDHALSRFPVPDEKEEADG